MQRIPNRFRAHNILKPGISRVTVGYIIDVLDSGNLLVSGGRNHLACIAHKSSEICERCRLLKSFLARNELVASAFA
jgi:hypothetical protein